MEKTDESPLQIIVNMLFAVFLFCFEININLGTCRRPLWEIQAMIINF